MAIDWDGLLLGPVMGIFGEGQPADPSSWPVYYPLAGGSLRLEGAVYDSEYADTTVVGDTPVTARRPVLGVRASLFSEGPDQGAGVFVPSVNTTFAIADVRPDGHGHILLILMETDA